MKYMPRGFADARDLADLFRCDASQLAACFRALKGTMLARAAVRRMAFSVVALHVAANVVDYYITTDAAKPMEQLQNLITQYALGMRRLEDDEAKESAAASEENPLKVDPKLRAKRVVLRLQFSANRSSRVSAIECALFVHTEQPHWISHNEVP